MIDQTGVASSADHGGRARATHNHGLTDLVPYRVWAEKPALYLSLAVLAVVVIVSETITLGVVTLAILGAWVYVKMEQRRVLGSCLRVSTAQMSRVFELTTLACRRLRAMAPQVFIEQDPSMQASAFGFLGKQSVVVTSGAAQALTDDELLFVLGHEIAHIVARHTRLFPATSSVEARVRIPIVSTIIGYVLLLWSRQAEYTADRGGLLACGKLEASMRAIVKVAAGKEAGEMFNAGELDAQREEFERSWIGKFVEATLTHPVMLKRLRALQAFANSPLYSELMNEETAN